MESVVRKGGREGGREGRRRNEGREGEDGLRFFLHFGWMSREIVW